MPDALPPVIPAQFRPLVRHRLQCVSRRRAAGDGVVDLLAGKDVPGSPPAGQPLLDPGLGRLYPLQRDIAPTVDRGRDLGIVVKWQHRKPESLFDRPALLDEIDPVRLAPVVVEELTG